MNRHAGNVFQSEQGFVTCYQDIGPSGQRRGNHPFVIRITHPCTRGRIGFGNDDSLIAQQL